MTDLDQRILITGANSGLGLETAKDLLRRGVKEVILACRTIEKSEQAKRFLTPLKKEGTIISIAGGFDMTDPKSIHNAVLDLSQSPIDTVFLNAGGVIFSNKKETVSWNNVDYEKTIFQNVLGGYLVYLFLKKSRKISINARIVFSGGEGARGIPGLITKPQFQSTEALRKYILGIPDKGFKYNPMNAIGISKYFAALLCKGLHTSHDRTEDFVWFSPGFTSGTGGLKGLPPIQEWIMQSFVFRLLSVLGMIQSPEIGGRKNADCLVGDIGESGQLIGSPDGKTIGRLVDQTPLHSDFSNKLFIDEAIKVARELEHSTNEIF